MNPRTLLALLALLAAGLIAGCGDDSGGDEADSGTDATQLLEETFKGDKQIDSGRLDLALNVSSSEGQPIDLKVSGPFQSAGEGKVPELDIDASIEGGGQSIQAGVTSTGDAGFVSYAGTDYEIAGPVWQQFKAGYEETAKQGENQSLASLGLNPRNWLKDPQNAGEAKVGDDDTIKITGSVDVPKLLDDVNTALEQLRQLGGAGATDLPEQLTDEQRQQAIDAIKQLDVEIYTGSDDKILRRILVTSAIETESGETPVSADLALDLQLLDVNEDQEIEAPENPQPFEELAAQLEQLGLGGLGLGGPGGGGGEGGGTSAENLEQYTDCIQEAAGDEDKVRECADLLTP